MQCYECGRDIDFGMFCDCCVETSYGKMIINTLISFLQAFVVAQHVERGM